MLRILFSTIRRPSQLEDSPESIGCLPGICLNGIMKKYMTLCIIQTKIENTGVTVYIILFIGEEREWGHLFSSYTQSKTM